MRSSTNAIDVSQWTKNGLHPKLSQPFRKLDICAINNHLLAVQNKDIHDQPIRACERRRLEAWLGRERQRAQVPISQDSMLPESFFTHSARVVDEQTSAQGADDSVNVHRMRVRDLEHLNAVALRNLGAKILDAFAVGDVAQLAEQSLAETHKVGRVEGDSAVVDHPPLTADATACGSVVNCVWGRRRRRPNDPHRGILSQLSQYILIDQGDLLPTAAPGIDGFDDVIIDRQEPIARHGARIATDFAPIHVLGSVHFDVFTLKGSGKLIQFGIRGLRNVI